MAGQWIKYDTDLPEKPEVWELSSSLDVDCDAVVGKLLRVWTWFDSHTEEGNAPSVTKALLDRKVAVTGFCDAMIQVGWMIEKDGLIYLPNFDRHNGKTAKNRALTARRVTEHKRKTNDKGNGDSVTPSVTREEKSREEKKVVRARQVPTDFTLTAERKAVATNQQLSPEDEFAKFCDYHKANGSTFKDWDAAWRNWCRKAKEFKGKSGSPTKTPRMLN